jgi:hypothetical protein
MSNAIGLIIFVLGLTVILLAVSRTMQHAKFKPGRPVEYTDPAGRVVGGHIVAHAWISPTARVRSDEQEYEVPLGRIRWLEYEAR